jgi:RNA polymerase sigma-70 factor (ECF subfamily)
MDAPHSPLVDLLRRARAGDDDACGRLLDMYRDYLTFLARVQLGRRLQGKVEPSDLVQEAFLEAHRDFQQFHGQNEGELLAWLRRVLATSLADQIRRYHATQRRDPRLERRLTAELAHSSDALERSMADPSSSPSDKAARREEAVQLAGALEQLPPHYREVLLARHFEGLRFPEIAVRHGKTIAGVKKTWLRGLALLRRTLKTR